MNTQDIIYAYVIELKSIAEISRISDLSTYKVKKILIDNSIPIRSRKEQNALTNKARAKHVNHEYFDNIDSCQKAWLLGFLASDGWIEKERNRINIELSIVDKEILEKIKNELNIESEILVHETGNGFTVCRLSWTSQQQKEQLVKFGIVHRKTYEEMHLPKFNNPDLIYAFILGFFDGDGSISISADDYIRFRLVAHRPELLEDIKEFLKVGNISKDNRGLYEFAVSTTNAVPLFNKLYSLDCFSLQRKHNKFLEYNKSTRV